MRNLTKTLVAMSLLAPMTAHSLGVGELKLHSALNQKLNAEIGLSLSAGEHLDDIKVTLATPDQFDKLGISWSYFISKIQLKPIVKSNGKVVIKVTSDQILQEPILDFLLEVSWPSGEIFKEYTVLVDPPVVYQQAVIDTPPVSVAKPKKHTRRAAPTPVQENGFSSLVVKGEYGPTNRGDSLWKVAKKVNQHNDVSIEQMMMALYKANPTVFYKNNVNALMEGKTLNIPEKAKIIKLSKKQAHAQFYRQMAVWEGRAVPEPEPVIVVEPNVESEIQDTSDANTKLTLESPSEEAISQSAALRADATEAEQLVSENVQMQERLANLEKQFVIMQEMMAIKDQQLAAMQNAQLAPESQADANSNQDNTVITDEIEEQANPGAVIEEPGTVVEPVETSQPQANKPETAAEKNPPIVQVKETPKEVVAEDSGINYYYLGTALLALLGFGWLLGRKRQTEEEINESSLFTAASEISTADSEGKISVPVLDKKTAYDVGEVDESSFLSEFTPDDFDVFETDQAEVDPISETDVYLAYGRYQQAEELMRQAITDHPEKDEYRLKLLEIFYASENEGGFNNYASELIAAGKKTDINFWSKVTAMRSELIPDSPLFSAREGESTFAASDVADDDYLNASTNLTHDDVGSGTEAISKSLLIDDDNTPDAAEPANASEQDELFVEDGADTDNQIEPAVQIKPTESIESSETDSADIDDIESIDFDLSQFEAIETSEHGESNLVDDLETFDFNSGEPKPLNKPAVDEAQDNPEEAEAVKPAENNDFDFDFDFDEAAPVSAEAITDADSNVAEVSDITDRDEFETKIDLAKAYIDMGDQAAAKEIVQEVLAQGNDTQKLEAQAIIDKLG